MGSILTGKYPLQNHLHNPDSVLPAEITTNAEFATKYGFQTSFFSGGAPVLHRTGIHQGFDYFEDSFSTNAQLMPFKSFQSISHDFFEWLDEESGSSPFFSVLYVPDLRFIQTDTISESGELRSKTFESQFENFDTSLWQMTSQLKARGLWDKTTIILTGLNGPVDENQGLEPTPLNLHSEHTQVGLIIKPIHHFRESNMSWTFDKTVSLADLGMTLFDLIREYPQNNTTPPPNLNFINTNLQEFETLSLLPTLQTNKKMELNTDRPILIESDWAKWQQLGQTRIAIIQDNMLCFWDQSPVKFRITSDRSEVNEIKESCPLTLSLANLGLAPYQKSKALSTAFPQWESTWLETELIQKKSWKDLEKLSIQTKNQTLESFAKIMLGQNKTNVRLPCTNLLLHEGNQYLERRQCPDHLTQEFYNFLHENDFDKQEFLINYRSRQKSLVLQMQNRKFGSIWQSVQRQPAIPIYLDVLLTLPQLAKERELLVKSLQ